MAQADPGAWPRYGHDGALTGRSPLVGEITEPAIAWEKSLAGRQVTLVLLPEKGAHELKLDSNTAPTGSAKTVGLTWDVHPLGRDLDGSGTPRPASETYHQRWADVLPEVKGLERVEWSHTWGTEKISRLRLFAHDKGRDQPRLVWQIDPPEGVIFNPLNIVYDIDGDGVQEILTAAHYRVMIFEGTTGRKESELRYHSNRPYGWFGLFDVDADGQMELITLGDFQSHFDVLAFDPKQPEDKRLSVKWRRDVETDISNRTKWPRIGPRPVIDATGDERLEIVVNVFNDTGDGQWHVQVINACTGSVLRDLPGRFVRGSADVTGDGKEDLFCVSTLGVVVPTFGRIELLDLTGEEPRAVFAAEHSRWGQADLPRLGPNWSTTGTRGMEHVLRAGPDDGTRRWLVWRQETDSTTDEASVWLTAWLASGKGGLASTWSLSGIRGPFESVALAVDDESPGPRVLVRLTLAAGTKMTLRGTDVRPVLIKSEARDGRNAPPIAARLEKKGPVCVLAEGAGNRLFALEPPGPSSDSRTPRIRWSVPGRGMTTGSFDAGLCAADLDGDGGCEVIAASEQADGQAELIAYRHDGGVLWRRTFEGIPGSAPVWNEGGLTLWWPGQLRQSGKVDLFVNLRMGLMHSDVGVLVDGNSGKTVWRRDKADAPGVFHWGYAGSALGVEDVTGDKRDELINLYPVCFWVGDGRTGNFLSAVDLAGRKTVPAWAAYGFPLVHDFTGNGRREVLLDSLYILALLDARGEVIWHGPPRCDYPSGKPEDNVGQTTQVKHALVDFDGDGRFEIASGGYADGVRAIDPRDGRILWRLSSPTPTCPKVCGANIDGRPGDELIYPAGNNLLAVTGDRTAGGLLWTWTGPAPLSTPAIADLDEDGKAEIVVRAENGTIYCLDAPQR